MSNKYIAPKMDVHLIAAEICLAASRTLLDINSGKIISSPDDILTKRRSLFDDEEQDIIERW